jgi:thioredoxin reductase
VREVPGGLSLELRTATEPASTRSLQVVALLLCTGTRFNEAAELLRLPGVEAARAAGLVVVGSPPAPAETAGWLGRHVVIVGGGDNAYHAAVGLCGLAGEVHLCHRRPARAQAWLLAEARAREAAGQLHIWPEHQLHEVRHSPARAVLARRGQHQPVELRLDRLVCLLGYRPNSEAWARLLGPLGQLERTADGYLVVDGSGHTSLPRIYAAGDVANPEHPCVATAMAMGSVAARSIERDLRAGRSPG